MHDTVMLVLDDKYVVTEDAIEGMKFTLPENYIWCLTHMTTSGKARFTKIDHFKRPKIDFQGVRPGFWKAFKDNVGAHCRDVRYAIHGEYIDQYLGNVTIGTLLTPSEELTARMRINSDLKISWRKEHLFLKVLQHIFHYVFVQLRNDSIT